MVIQFPSRPRAALVPGPSPRIDVDELLLQLLDAGIAGDPESLRGALGRLGCADEREALTLVLQRFLRPAQSGRPRPHTYIPY